ncbi:MAG: hypothetical protein HY707_00745 [Ignavibacteriae bacterium]|nr:hypothetical protein [Ignavibacteriota bacterium]
MASMIDIILAFTLGGILLIIILNANDVASTHASLLNGDMLVQQMLVSITQILEGEIRNMGFNVPVGSPAIINANDTLITFLSDLYADGTTDTVGYYLGSLSELQQTQHDSDRLLHRKVNSDPAFSLGAVTRFSLRYFSQGLIDTLIPPRPGQPYWIARRPGGTFVENPFDYREIKVIELTLEVQNPYALYKRADDPTVGAGSSLYSSSMWRQTRLASQNLRR